jgi:hypothetical protein
VAGVRSGHHVAVVLVMLAVTFLALLIVMSVPMV